jgi:hypothetical protein
MTEDELFDYLNRKNFQLNVYELELLRKSTDIIDENTYVYDKNTKICMFKTINNGEYTLAIISS